MKLNQKLKLTLVILIVILLSIIGFAGIYVQNKNTIYGFKRIQKN